MGAEAATAYRFGRFVLHRQRGVLLSDGAECALRAKSFALLRHFVENAGRLIDRDEIMRVVWPGVFVTDDSIAQCVRDIRRALGDNDQQLLRTLPRRGYRFIAPVVAEVEESLVGPPPVDAAQAAAPTPRSDAERRQVTAMSCELIGLSGRADDIDLENLREAVVSLQQCVLETVGRYDGVVINRQGNTALVLFGYPAAHEYNAEQAVRAGLELCAAVKSATRAANGSTECRIGVATGMVIIGNPVGAGKPWPQEIVGNAPILAAQLQLSAQPNTVVIDAATRRLIGNLFDCCDLGMMETNGGAEPARRWQVLEARVGESRFEALRGPALSPLIGREEEIDLLLRRWARAKAGDGQVVLISGEPGIGKSRLTAELERRLHTEPHTRLRYFCSPYHQDSTLYPFADQFGRASGFALDDPPAARLQKLEVLLARAAAPAEDVALIADLLSLPRSERHPLPKLTPQRKKERTLEALFRELEDLARQQPVLMDFEDAHWVDPTSRELLDLTIERIRDLPILLIVTFRPEFQPVWIGQPQVTMLALNRLDRRDRGALVMQIASGRALPDKVVDQLVDRSDGVPLFIEELTKSVLESGVPLVGIPTTLHDSLMARLDRLGSVRLVAQIGAAIGRQFPYGLVHAVSDLPEDELRAALDRLVGSELVFQRGTPPEAVYTFKHALVQDAAHGSLLRDARQRLHRQIAEALATHAPELMDSQPELFARHYAEAGLVQESVIWWGKAGDEALRRSAFQEAAAHFGKAIELADKLAASAGTTLSAAPGINRLRLQTRLGNALLWAKGHHAPETSAAFAKARELASREEDASERFSIYYGLWAGHLNRREPAPMREIAELFLSEAAAQPDCPETLVAHRISGNTCFQFGDFAGAHRHYQKTIELYDRARHGHFASQFGQDPCAAAKIYDALALWVLGRIDEALSVAGRALADAESAAHAPTMAYTLAFAALLGLLRYNVEAVATCGQGLADIVSRYDLPAHWPGIAVFSQGWANRSNGAEAATLAEMRRGLAIYHEEGRNWLSFNLEAVLAEGEASAGEIDSGLRRLDAALAELEPTEERWYEGEMQRIRAGILLKRDPANTGVAERSLQAAIAVAQSQKARSFELRAALSLAKLYGRANRDADAHAVLAPAVEGFLPTQNFPELAEAQTLLSTLSP